MRRTVVAPEGFAGDTASGGPLRSGCTDRLTNVDPNQHATVAVRLDGITGTTVTGRILTAATMDAHNSFESPDVVKPTAFTGATLSRGGGGGGGRSCCRRSPS